jgi:hypothetical protein
VHAVAAVTRARRSFGTVLANVHCRAGLTLSETAMNADLPNRGSDLKVGPGTTPGLGGSLWQSGQRPAGTSLAAAPVLAWSIACLLGIGFFLWLGFSWSGYAERFAQAGGGWRKGGTQLVEITLIRDDVRNLACASDQSVASLHCAYTANGKQLWSEPSNVGAVLRPYSTVKGDLLLGKGLWDSPLLPASLPGSRFTVVCNFEMLGVLKSVAFRWSLQGAFDPSKESVPVGALNDCSIPP